MTSGVSFGRPVTVQRPSAAVMPGPVTPLSGLITTMQAWSMGRDRTVRPPPENVVFGVAQPAGSASGARQATMSVLPGSTGVAPLGGVAVPGSVPVKGWL